MHKDFDNWNQHKKQINYKTDPARFSEMEVWWCSVGLNIGDEQDGKGESFVRPVLILRKFNQRIFLCVPLTTQIKENPYYFPFELKGRKQCAMISQIRLLDSRRLRDRLGVLGAESFKQIKQRIVEIIL